MSVLLRHENQIEVVRFQLVQTLANQLSTHTHTHTHTHKHTYTYAVQIRTNCINITIRLSHTVFKYLKKNREYL